MAIVKWTVDAAHSELTFKVRHLMISTVTGHFRKFTLELETDDNIFQTARFIHFCADVNSLDTNSEQRDHHLKSVDFFDSKTYPEMIFIGNKITGTGENLLLTGDLTIRGTTKPVNVELHFNGMVTDGYGQVKAGFSIQGTINRRDFGLVWGATTETGRVVVGDEIRYSGEIQLIRQDK
jgi:polyisoprenoid-binding protein YceI